MRTWASSHYNAWQLYGHSHARLEPIGKQMDVGVDAHGFFPIHIDQVCKHMLMSPNDPNYIGDKDGKREDEEDIETVTNPGEGSGKGQEEKETT